jgi:hypothetical protein
MKILLIYIMIGLCLAYLLKHQLDVVKLLPRKANIRSRNKISKKQNQLELYIKLCLVWPILLIKEVYDEIKERRQS